MASQSSMFFFILLFVLVGAATCGYTQPYFQHISVTDLNYSEKVQFLGKFAVDQYNKNGVPQLNFLQVVNGQILHLTILTRIWILDVKAQNCGQSGTEALYLAEIDENIFVPGQIQAYGSNFTTGVFRKADN